MKTTTHNQPLCFEHNYYSLVKGAPKRIFLILHGYLLDGEFIFNQFKDSIPDNSLLIAPNGPFPVPVKKRENFTVKYAWYFFDPGTKNYYINFEPAARFLKELLKNHPDLPVTVIGYSQGGYLSPKVAEIVSAVDSVVGLCCTFRNNRFKQREDVSYFQINSSIDAIVEIENSLKEFNKLEDNSGKFITLDNATHRISQEHKHALKELLKKNFSN